MSSPWLLGWGNRVEGVIDHNDIDSAQTWFPARFHLSASCGINSADLSFIFDELGANSKKIAIVPVSVAQIDANQLYGEIEKWDSGNEEAELWVSKDGWPISDTADTPVYLYFDKDHADNDTYIGIKNSTPAQSVWDANFKAVYHMADGADTSSIYDSTSNNNDGTKKGAAEPAEADELIGKAQDYDGSDDYITVGTMGNLGSEMATNKPTIEARVKTSTTDAVLSVLGIANDGSTTMIDIGLNSDQAANVNAGYIRAFIRDEDGNAIHSDVASDTGITDGSAHTLAIRWDGPNDTVDYFVDGAKQTTHYVAQTTPDNFANFAYALAVGAVNVRDTMKRFYEDILDEVRISNDLRSDAWLKASHESQRDHLITWGIKEFYIPRHSFTNFQIPGIV